MRKKTVAKSEAEGIRTTEERRLPTCATVSLSYSPSCQTIEERDPNRQDDAPTPPLRAHRPRRRRLAFSHGDGHRRRTLTN